MFDFAYEAIIMIIAGFFLLRLAGKKVIAEMTPLELVTVLSIGTVIGHAVAEDKVWQTIVCIALFVIILICFQLLSFKISFFERFLIGKPTLIIEDGQILTDNLKKLRMTVSQLELRVRQQGISRISDIRTATIEINGHFGFELIESARPVTRGELEELLYLLELNVQLSKPKESEVFDYLRETSE